MTTMPIRWTIKPLLDRHNLTAYRLMKETGLAQGTVYRLVNGTARSLNADTVDRVVLALRRLTGEPVQIGDLVSFEEPR